MVASRKEVFLGLVGPAFAHGCHDLGEPSVESVKLLSFGSARDEGVPVAGYAPAPYPLNGARRGDVGQRVTGHEDQVGALPGGDTSSVGETENSCRSSRGRGEGLGRADAAPYKELELSVQFSAAIARLEERRARAMIDVAGRLADQNQLRPGLQPEDAADAPDCSRASTPSTFSIPVAD
jgi:hypothetical protein